MPSYTIDYLNSAHKHSIFHHSEILASEKCGCFYCLVVFNPSEIMEWVDEADIRGMTALCPRCNIDAVLGSISGYPVSDKEFLKEMNKRWF